MKTKEKMGKEIKKIITNKCKTLKIMDHRRGLLIKSSQPNGFFSWDEDQALKSLKIPHGYTKCTIHKEDVSKLYYFLTKRVWYK